MVEPLKATTIDYSKLQHHELSEIFPLMEGPEFDALVEDIKLHGVRERITLLYGKILDGRNRYKAGLKAGVRFTESHFEQPEDIKRDPLAFVISANLHRRHLNESQRAVVASKLVTTKFGDNQYKGNAITQETASKLLNVSVAQIKVADKLHEKGAPAVIEAVVSGKKRLGAVKSLLTKKHEEQVTALNATKNKVTKTAADKLEDAWDAVDAATKETFVETRYGDLKKLMKIVDQKPKAA
jgi:hypothetical protein